jgi:hypothetical protein
MKNANIVALATSAKENSATSFVRFIPDGGKRAKVVVLSVAEKFATTPGEFTFGSMKAGKFVPFGDTYRNEAPSVAEVKSAKAAKVSKAKKAPTAKKIVKKIVKQAEPATSTPAPKGDAGKLFEGKRRGSGYVAYIDELLFQLSGKKEKGYARSQHTVTEAVRLILKKFPEANPGSVRRVVKVRPRHLERSKTSGVDNKAPRWALAGVVGATEYMGRIDSLLMAGKLDKKVIAETVAKEFGRDVSKVLATIHARTPKLRAKHGKEAVGTKPARALKGESTKRQVTKAKNEALLKGQASNPAEVIAQAGSAETADAATS